MEKNNLENLQKKIIFYMEYIKTIGDDKEKIKEVRNELNNLHNQINDGKEKKNLENSEKNNLENSEKIILKLIINNLKIIIRKK